MLIAHAAASTITATPVPVSISEQVESFASFIAACAQPPPLVFDDCKAPPADCRFLQLPAASFRSSRSGASIFDFSVSASFSDGYSSTGQAFRDSTQFGAYIGHPAFPETASLTATVTITDTVDGSTAQVTAPVTVTERQVRAVGCDEHPATAGAPITNVHLASIYDSEQDTPDLTASLAWGDGTSSPGTMQPSGSYPDFVAGSHTYALPGRYTVTVTVSEPGSSGSAITVSTVIAVAATVPVPPTGAGAFPGLGLALLLTGLLLSSLAIGARR